MNYRSIVGGLALLVAVAGVSGCGDNDNNTNDNGSSGARCGNNVVDQSKEDCDGSDLDGATCQSLGFTGGTVSCSSSCTYVTSACTGSTNRTPTPVVTATPGPGATATATTVAATATAANPTPTATPNGGPACDGTESIVVKLSLDSNYTAARVDLGYTSSVNLPGSGTDQSVKDRVVFAPQGGISVKNDFDQSGDAVDDTVTSSFVGSDVQTAGLFVTITFDCVAGQPAPSAADFDCNVVSASLEGTSISPACTVALQ